MNATDKRKLAISAINRVITRSRRQKEEWIYNQKGADFRMNVFTEDGREIVLDALKELGFDVEGL